MLLSRLFVSPSPEFSDVDIVILGAKVSFQGDISPLFEFSKHLVSNNLCQATPEAITATKVDFFIPCLLLILPF